MVADFKDAQLQHVIDAVNKVVRADRIYLLGVSIVSEGGINIFRNQLLPQTVFEYQLLIVYPDHEKRQEEELQHIVEASARSFTPITTILIPLKVFNQWLVKGHLLAHHVTHTDCLVYSNEETRLSVPGSYEVENLVQKVRKEFNEWNTRAADFLYGVDAFHAHGKYNAASFLLHQATELSFMAVIRLVTGYRAGTHNLERMIRYAVPFCGQETNVFPRNNEKERRLFKMLQKAYIHSRYKDDFDINEHELVALIERVQRLVVAVHTIGEEYNC